MQEAMLPRELAFQCSHWSALAGLWRQQMLCDVQLRAPTGELLAAHGIVLASTSGFFRALLCGAGRSMREGCAAAGGPRWHGAAAPAQGSGQQQQQQQQQHMVVDLPYSAQQLSALLDIVYGHKLTVCGVNVAWLLDMAAYLEVQPLQEACCEFLSSALTPDTVVDVLLLSHRYHCAALQDEGVQFLAQRLASLLLAPDGRQGLLRLPEPVLQQLLGSEALEVEQETELLCLLADWVCCAPRERRQQLPVLLPQLQLSVLPREQLTPHQLRSCTSPEAAALAQQLHWAVQQHCSSASSMPQQQQQQQQGLHSPSQQLVGQGSPSKQRRLMPAAEAMGGGRGSSSSSMEAGSGAPRQDATKQLHIPPAEHGRGNSTRQDSGNAASSTTSSSSSSSMWWPGEWADANNHACGASSSGHTCSYTSQPPPAELSDHGPMASSRAAASAGAGPPDAVLGAAATSAGGASSSSSCGGGGGVSGGSGSGDTQRLWDVCELGRIGAVLLEAWPGRQRGHQPTSILVAGGHDPSWRGLRSVEVYDPAADAWSQGPTLPAALPFAGAGLPSKGQLYVIGGPMCSSYMARLDVAGQVWCNCEGPRLSRLHAAVTGSAGLLYLTGGRTQVNQVVAAVEAYDPGTCAWRPLPDMLHARYAHALVAQGGCIYALGGQASKAIHRTVEVFDAQRGGWQALGAQLTSERKYCAAASLGGRLVVLGGLNEARCRLSSIEAYDPREGRWSSLTDMQCPRSSCSVACLGGRLYVMGGSAGDDRLHGSVEAFDPAAGRWRSCAALSCHRSGLTAAAV